MCPIYSSANLVPVSRVELASLALQASAINRTSSTGDKPFQKLAGEARIGRAVPCGAWVTATWVYQRPLLPNIKLGASPGSRTLNRPGKSRVLCQLS